MQIHREFPFAFAVAVDIATTLKTDVAENGLVCISRFSRRFLTVGRGLRRFQRQLGRRAAVVEVETNAVVLFLRRRMLCPSSSMARSIPHTSFRLTCMRKSEEVRRTCLRPKRSALANATFGFNSSVHVITVDRSLKSDRDVQVIQCILNCPSVLVIAIQNDDVLSAQLAHT